MPKCPLCEVGVRVQEMVVRQRDVERARVIRLEEQVEKSRKLLLAAREYIHGCAGLEDEVCECAECERATALLDLIDAASAENREASRRTNEGETWVFGSR